MRSRRSVTTALALAAAPLVAAAQSPADSAAKTAESAGAATGVYLARPPATDTVRAPGDSATATADSSPAQAPPGAPLVVNVAPPDTVLLRACAGELAGSPAPGLLDVVFRAGTDEKQKAATAKSVGGALAGGAAGGGEYLRLPPDAPPLTVVADRLILQASVTQVSPAPCPTPPLPSAPREEPAPTESGASGAPPAPPARDSGPRTARGPRPPSR